MARKIRPARMAAMYVEWGDVIVTAPSDVRVIGTVTKVRGSVAEGFNWMVRKPTGAVEEFPANSRMIDAHRPVWVNVPGGTA